MFLQRLKINLSVHLVVLIGLGMIAVDFAMTTSFQKIMVNHEISNSRLLISALQKEMDRHLMENGRLIPEAFISAVSHLVQDSGYVCAYVLDRNFRPVYQNNTVPEPAGGFTPDLKKVMVKKKRDAALVGETWGVFWKSEAYLIISFPMYQDEKVVAGVAMAYDLMVHYQALRQMQLLLWLFMGVMTVVLAFLGFYQLSKIAVNPIYRLLRRMEAFEPDDQALFQIDDKSDEFKRLSFSLNQMLMRINQDKQMLQDTIKSLEEANRDLKLAQKEIIKSEKLASVGRLSAGIAHEIGNPISIILGYIALLKKENIQNQDKAEYIRRAENEILRVRNIVRQLLDYSRPDHDGNRTVSSHRLINDLVRMISLQPKMDNISIVTDLKATKDRVNGSPDLLLQVFLNLAMNAADAVLAGANNENGKIIISTENRPDDDDELLIRFVDNGIGISEEERQILFDPFFHHQGTRQIEARDSACTSLL